MTLRIAGFNPSSRVNGPGARAVLHLQGCSLACPGCFNPETHPTAGGRVVGVERLADDLAAAAVDGVTISGGEPFQQPEGLLALVRALRDRGIDSILVFSGYALDEIEALTHGQEILAHIDVLVAGRYDPTRAAQGSLLASENQRAHLLTGAHTPDELALTGEVEITIRPDGSVHMTGFPTPGLRRSVRRLGEGA